MFVDLALQVGRPVGQTVPGLQNIVSRHEACHETVSESEPDSFETYLLGPLPALYGPRSRLIDQYKVAPSISMGQNWAVAAVNVMSERECVDSEQETRRDSELETP